jgi:hypothetical protein
MDNQKIGFLQLLALAMLVNVVAQAIHEAGHWTIYQAYGRGPVWGFIGLVQVWDAPPLHPNEWVETSSLDGERGWLRLTSPSGSKTESMLAAAAGPLASLLAAVLALIVTQRSKETRLKHLTLMLALMNSFLMSAYYLRSPLRTGGSDEADVAALLGIPKAWIEILFGLAFIVCFILSWRLLGNWRTRFKWLGILLLGSILSALPLVQADAVVRAQINLNNPFFQPILGFSLPVFIVNIGAVLLLWLWWQRGDSGRDLV